MNLHPVSMDELWSRYLVILLGFCHPFLLKLAVMKPFCAFLLLIENFNQINFTYNTDENKYDTFCKGEMGSSSCLISLWRNYSLQDDCIEGGRKSLVDQVVVS